MCRDDGNFVLCARERLMDLNGTFYVAELNRNMAGVRGSPATPIFCT